MFGRNPYNYQAFQRECLSGDSDNPFGSAPAPGDRAPDFEARTLDGRKMRLKNFRGKKNLVLTFGSATCPQTAGSLSGLNDLYQDRDEDVEFLFIYVREAHPGERIAAHASESGKRTAAELLRDQERVDIPIAVDDLDGTIHRKYGTLPNPTFLIDKSGRISFRSLSSRQSAVAEALEELLDAQESRDTDHVVVRDGEDLSQPSLPRLLRAHRALLRGGRSSIRNFRREMGVPGRMILTGSRVAQPILDNPGKTIAGVVAAAGVIAAGVWVGLFLRRKRLSTYRSPYESRRFRRRTYSDPGDYEAVGI